jgi:TP901 family phage tail tape measure protein
MAEVGSIKATLTLRTDQFKKGMADARKEMDVTAKKSQALKKEMTGIQSASAAVGTAILASVAAAGAVAIDFEKQMSRVKAIASASEEEFARLKETAMELGATTSKSASEIALGMEDVAAMGFNVNEIIGAMPGIIAAAEASGADLATTSGIVAAALNSFQLEASDASKVADILAKTANISAANINDMGYAFKYAAPVANTLGISMEELAAMTGIMVDSGLEGSQAGTTLRMALLSLADPTSEGAKALENLGVKATDANGNFLDFADILPQFVDGLEGMTDAQKAAELSTIFGTEAVSGMLAVIGGGIGNFEDFTEALENSAGASKQTADIMKDNVAASFDEFKGALETLSIDISDEFLPTFREIVDTGTDVVRMIGELDPRIVASGLKMGAASTGTALLLSTIGKLSLALRALSLSPVGMAITGLSLLAGVVVGVKDHMDRLNEVNLENAETMTKNYDELDASISRYDELKEKSRLSADELGRFVDINADIKKNVDPKIIEDLHKEQEELQKKSGLSNDELLEMLELNDKIIEKVPHSTTVISDQGKALLESTDAAKDFNQEQLDMIRFELEVQRVKAEAKHAEYLEKEKSLVEDINGLNGDKIDLEGKIVDMKRDIVEETRKIEEAETNGNKVKEWWHRQNLGLMEIEYQKLLDERSVIYDTIKAKEDKLDATREELAKLGLIEKQMKDLELAQVDLTAEHGKELDVIDKEIGKLQAKRLEIEKSTPAAAKNTQEYKNAVGAIDTQIRKLRDVRSNVIDIEKEAREMNASLRQPITKTVNVITKGGAGPDIRRYHTGGRVGHPALNDFSVANVIGDDSEESRQKVAKAIELIELVMSQ